MKRNFLFAWYQTPQAKVFRKLEIEYLQRAITVSCKQTVLQIGGLGWEDEFVDCSLYKYYTILDANNLGSANAQKIQAKAYRLPLQCASVDMIIVPHLLEFDSNRFQTMREIERVLKPEGIVLIMNFNPWSLWIRYQYLWELKMADSWRGHFINRGRVLDWLKLLNFEVIQASDFYIDNIRTTHSKQITGNCALSAVAYGVKAIKRRYSLIPLTPVKQQTPSLILANTLNSSAQLNEHD